jgi:glycosyltransferase involved in cell wall biosynthesis
MTQPSPTSDGGESDLTRSRRSVRIVARANKVGVDRDITLLGEALSAWGPEPVFSGYRSISPLRRLVGRPDPSETLVFLERVTARWLRHAGRYVLVPNQERYPRRLVGLLERVDHVFCKSRHAEEVFRRFHGSVHYLGFTSPDRQDPEVAPDYDRFFHLAGGSALKGTGTLLEVWRAHPEWPTLTLLQHRREDLPDSVPENVELIDRYLPDEELRRLQNRCGVHLCPSLSEGWGHYIGEALSCGAVTVVTDGPPMNELVGADRGVVVGWHRSEPRKLGTNYHVDPKELEAAVGGLLARSTEEKARLGRAARSWFEENDARFRARLRELWEGLEL